MAVGVLRDRSEVRRRLADLMHTSRLRSSSEIVVTPVGDDQSHDRQRCR